MATIRCISGGAVSTFRRPKWRWAANTILGADPRYAGIDVPRTESLKLTIERVLPYFNSDILPVIARGETVIISAHGNSLRALVKHLSDISDDDITGLEIPTGQPIVYEFDGARVSGERYYLKDR